MAVHWCRRLLYPAVFALIFSVLVSCAYEDSSRFNCYPEGEANETLCAARNCIWQKPATQQAKGGAPSCFYNTSRVDGYTWVSSRTLDSGSEYFLKRAKQAFNMYNEPIDNAKLSITHQTKDRLRIKFSDEDDNSRYEVPIGKTFPQPSGEVSNPQYTVDVVQEPFSFKIRRAETKAVLWDTSVGLLMMYDQYLQLSTKLPSSNVYGFGEHEHNQFHHDMKWTTYGMFARDQWVTANANLYGVHPFYMGIEDDGNAYGVLFLNSNAMDVTLQPLPALTYRTIGGVLDFYFFLGPTPEMVVQQYTELIGRTFMPPYWSLGFQLCRYGYNHIDVVKETVARMKKYDIPLDVQYGDIDYMERQLDFTYSRTKYAGLPEFVRQIKSEGIRYITILDPAISTNELNGKYEPYELGQKLGIWIIDSNTSKPLIGKVWPDRPNVVVDPTKDWDTQTKLYRAPAVFPDFFHKDIDKWWGFLIEKFHKTLEFDGLWIDMNEPANFVSGTINGCEANKYDNPPYKPHVLGDVLADKTLCMNSKHGDGTLHYNLHSLYGWSECAPSQRAAQLATKKRSVVISRSTYPSSGVTAGHWLGDNHSTWPDLRRSVIGMMEFNLFGIPYVGADICGFNNNVTVPLCRRWMQLGAFYPFSRNHNGIGYMPQDPAFFGEEFANGSRDVLRTRYELLPYLYTLFYEAHTKGSTVVRPMMHEFIQDKTTWSVDRQFLWGPALLITPVLEDAVTVKGYFPDARWFDFYTGKELSSYRKKQITLDAPEWHIPLHVRGGSIIPMQGAANNTVYSRKKDMMLLVALGDDDKASGTLFWDDGESIGSIKNGQYQLIEFNANKGGLTMTMKKNGLSAYAEQFRITMIKVYGNISPKGDAVTVNGEKKGKISRNSTVIRISQISLPINQNYQLYWSSGSKCLQMPLVIFAFVISIGMMLHH